MYTCVKHKNMSIRLSVQTLLHDLTGSLFNYHLTNLVYNQLLHNSFNSIRNFNKIYPGHPFGKIN